MFERIFDKKTSVALGSFDGLHIGHRAVVMNAAGEADRGLVPVVLLFDEHPLSAIKNAPPEAITTKEELENEIKALNAVPVTVSFKSIMNMTPEEFIDTILVGMLNAGAVSCGFNFRFGRNSSGNPEILKKLCDDRSIKFIITDEVDYLGKPVSSTRIRKAIADGDMISARNMLGHNFYYVFTVESGDRIGRTLGFPTINQFFPDNFAIPKFGVYASTAYVENNPYPAVTDIGIRPTLEHKKPRSETNIIGFSGDLYYKKIKIELLKFIRPEIKFSSLDELKIQIAKDSSTAEKIYEKARK